MGLDTDFAGILRDFVQFLESLGEVKLPPTIENVRENLLSRSKASLLNFVIGAPSSPEPYLDMNAGKGLLLAAKSHNEIQEYINTDHNSEPRPNQDYYETFQEINSPKTDTHLSTEDPNEESLENTLVSIYSSLSAAQTRATCNKCGQLYRKEGRKLLIFDPLRSCWVGLVGSHLLIYGSEKDSRPNTVIPIRGYKVRPAPSVVPRDPKRSESAFEIFCPGHKTLQFVAKTPEEMEEWVSTICEMSINENDNKTRLRESPFTETLETEQKEIKNVETSLKEEKYQDILFRPAKSKESLLSLQHTSAPDLDKNTKNEIILRENANEEKIDIEETPPLPARIPRRLPSLPHEEAIPSFEPVDEAYDEDDIYHKIEDFRDGSSYQNFMVAKKEGERKKEEIEAKKNCCLETYDDVDDVANGIRVQKTEQDLKIVEVPETYDDVQPASSETILSKTEIKKEETVVDGAESYDDVHTIAIDLQAKPVQEPKEEKVSGAARIKASKKSFLDRMRNRSSASKKEEKKKRSTSPVSQATETLPTYDDVSQVAVNPIQQKESKIEEQSEYICPPAPRPIYSVPPAVATCLVEQLYDDIAACQDKIIQDNKRLNIDTCINSSSINQKSTEVEVCPMKLDIIPEQCFQSESNNSNGPEMEFEHYQIPRSDRVLQVEEVLYDDVALLAKFRAKPRESTVSNFEKVWSRFSSGRSKSSAHETEENNDSSSGSNDQQEMRVNRFQKLVSKIENTLGKSSVKPVPLSNTKSHSSSNVT